MNEKRGKQTVKLKNMKRVDAIIIGFGKGGKTVGTDRKKSDGTDSGKRKSLGQSEVVRCGKERGTAGGRNDRGSEIKKT